MGMYTRPGQQGEDEMRRDFDREACECRHIIWTHRIMGDKSCTIDGCKCLKFKRPPTTQAS